MTCCVLDCTVALAWILPGEATSATDALQDRVAQEGALIPALFPLEFANTLLVSERRGRLTAAHRDSARNIMAALPLEMEPGRPIAALGATLDLAATHRLGMYDAVYLDLAIRHRLPLASLDRALRQAADSVGIALLGR